MILIFIGILLLFFPVIVFTLTSKNKYIGFSNGLIFIIYFHITLAVLSQLFHSFTYPTIVTISSIANVILLFIFRRKIGKIGFSISKEFFNKFDWMLLFVLVISIFCLHQVHYNYTGKVSVISKEYKQVQNFNYPYPYYSDEWYAVALIKQSLKTRALPIKNPLRFRDTPFTNFEYISHSFLSELVLIMRLNPVLDYTKLTVGFNVLIISLIYLFLRNLSIPPLTSGIAALTTLFITNGANLPGIWTLIPLTVGLIPLLTSLFYFAQKNSKMIFVSGFLSLIFYPPLIVVFTPALLFFFLESKGDLNKNKKALLFGFSFIVLAGGITVALGFLWANKEWSGLIPYISTKLFYNSYALPKYMIWNVLPWPIVLTGLLALMTPGLKIKWLKSMTIVGLLYWITYSFTTYRVIIEYQRVVYLTAVLIILIGGIGLHQLFLYLSRNKFFKKYYLIKFLQIGIVLFICFLSLKYTTSEKWRKLTLYHLSLKKTFEPAAPANMYLTQDDLRIFKNIHSEKFLSPQWKGTVIGVATSNYSACTKPGTITNFEGLYGYFSRNNCFWKSRYAKGYKVKYFYGKKLNCQNFIYKDRSDEGLFLYEYKEESQEKL